MLMLTRLRLTILCLCTVFPLFAIAGDDDKMYAVTITNLTRGQTFTPIMVISQAAGQPLFTLGQPANAELATLAESGNIAPLADKLINAEIAYDSATNGALLGPGKSVSIKIKFTNKFRYVSVAAMLIPSNDAFFAVSGMKGPKKVGHSKSNYSAVLDAGSENNDELCANIPGPTCGGEALSAGAGEGFVHIHAGIHGSGDLLASVYDWRNPAAKITIKRIE